MHYEYLKLYEPLDLKLQRFIEVLNAKKVPGWKSGNNFEVDFFKLMNNSVFGKTLEILEIGLIFD